MLRVEDPGVIDLGEIVVFGGQPEDRHRRNAVVGEPRGQLDRVQNFVNGVAGPGKQADLLSGDNRDGARLRQPFERRAVADSALEARRPARRAGPSGSRSGAAAAW